MLELQTWEQSKAAGLGGGTAMDILQLHFPRTVHPNCEKISQNIELGGTNSDHRAQLIACPGHPKNPTTLLRIFITEGKKTRLTSSCCG